MSLKWNHYCLLVLIAITNCTSAQESISDSVEKDYSAELPRIAPLTPNDAIRAFEIADGFEIELVACEPLVTDPVAFAFDARGRLWVAEMRDYSEQDTDRLGRIALLTDTNRDGRMDERTTFVENLSWPTAIFPWRDGVLVAEPPNITWYRDTNGDGVSDQSAVWFSGFGRGNVQGLVNSLRWGVDGWIHGATSSAGASLQAASNNQHIELGRRDFAIDPMTMGLRPETGGGQHGMYFNRWGDKFVTSNSDHLQQIVNMESWLAGHASSGVPVPALRRSIAEDGPQAEVFRASPIEPWRIVRTRLRMSGVAPGIVEGGGRAAGYFTGATGTLILDSQRGFGPPEHDTAIVCDVGSNLVHRKILLDQGLFYTARRIDHQTELLRSRDIWFRPVQIGEGPDGALYVADMYREVIEHPLSLPPMIKKHLDLTSGRDRGRIWRLVSQSTPTAPIDDFSQFDDAKLVAHLSSDLSWQRLMASQLLTERHIQQESNVPILSELLKNTALNSSRPEARVLSMWLLHRLGLKIDASTASQLLQQPHPRVLACAIEVIGTGTLSESAENSPRDRQSVQEYLIQLANQNNEPRAQLELSKLAPLFDEEYRWSLLASLLPDAREPLVRATIATSAGSKSWKLFDSEFGQNLDGTVYAEWLSLLLPSWISAARADSELATFIGHHLHANHVKQAEWLTALTRTSSHTAVASLLQLLGLQSAIDRQVVSACNESTDPRAIHWLGLASSSVQVQWMPQLIHSKVTETAQTAAISALDWANCIGLSDHLIANFRGMTPSLQQLALRTMAARPERLNSLLAALETGQIARSQIPAEIRQTLLSSPSAEVAARFSKVLVGASGDRAALIQHYQVVLDHQGIERASPENGKAVFERSCAQCHRLGQIGNDVGPPLRQLAEKSPTQLLETILDPSREVDPKYAAYTVLTLDGVVMNGIILQEAGNQIVLAEAGGKQTSLDRESIEQIQSSGLSLMPIGLEEQIPPEQMLDLIRYLKDAGSSP